MILTHLSIYTNVERPHKCIVQCDKLQTSQLHLKDKQKINS